MYRHVNIKEFYEQCMKTEYLLSIKYDYKVRPLLQSYFRDVNEFGKPDAKGLGLGSHLDFLVEVYQEIVAPMTKELKQLML